MQRAVGCSEVEFLRNGVHMKVVGHDDAADATGSVEPLARALEKISRGNEAARETAVDDSVNALCIFGEDRGIERLFSTHPPMEKRVQRLRL